MSEVRVRFAPSPTGYLHIGGARTALYNWLFARKHGGKFVLRIEDTDAERSTEASANAILDQLKWLGLDWDEGPNLQTENLEFHKQSIDQLVEDGHAYRCFCTTEELAQKREHARKEKLDFRYDGTCRDLPDEEVAKRVAARQPFVVRFKVPRKQTIAFDDLIQGHNEKSTEDIEDFVILRSDGRPLYILSNCVDDATDGITHIIRGQDGMANTPKQILLYRALGKPEPRFAHMALTLDMKGRKISKRVHGLAVSVGFFRDRGFLPWALCNALVLLGWSAGDDKEYYTREELIQAFSLEGCSNVNSKFGLVKEEEITDELREWTDPKALRINATYLRGLPLDELLPLVKKELVEAELWDNEYTDSKAQWLASTVDLIRERYFTLKDFTTLGRPFFSDDFLFEENAVNKNLKKIPETIDYLEKLAEALKALDGWTHDELENSLRAFAEGLGVKAGLIINGTRTAITGQAVGPGIFDILLTLGKEKTIMRLQEVGNKCS